MIYYNTTNSPIIYRFKNIIISKNSNYSKQICNSVVKSQYIRLYDSNFKYKQDKFYISYNYVIRHAKFIQIYPSTLHEFSKYFINNESKNTKCYKNYNIKKLTIRYDSHDFESEDLSFLKYLPNLTILIIEPRYILQTEDIPKKLKYIDLKYFTEDLIFPRTIKYIKSTIILKNMSSFSEHGNIKNMNKYVNLIEINIYYYNIIEGSLPQRLKYFTIPFNDDYPENINKLNNNIKYLNIHNNNNYAPGKFNTNDYPLPNTLKIIKLINIDNEIIKIPNGVIKLIIDGHIVEHAYHHLHYNLLFHL